MLAVIGLFGGLYSGPTATPDLQNRLKSNFCTQTLKKRQWDGLEKVIIELTFASL